jgi:hypothetical protein
MPTNRSWKSLIAAFVAIAVVVQAAPAESDMEQAYRKLVQERAPTLVTVKFLLKLKMSGMFASMGDQESEQEVSGIMIAPSGLVLVSSTELGGFAGMMRQVMGGLGGDISAVPTDLKVLVGGDTEGLEAELLARDSELDLAWVRIKDPAGKTFATADLSESPKPRLGQRLLMLSRMGKYFDRAPVVHEVRVSGFTAKPRELYVASEMSGPGMPVYTTDGDLVGVTVLQMPEAEDVGDNPFVALNRASDMMESSMAALILPARQLLRATERAEATAARQAAEAEVEEAAESEQAPSPAEE